VGDACKWREKLPRIGKFKEETGEEMVEQAEVFRRDMAIKAS
jgi:hypothetical protein